MNALGNCRTNIQTRSATVLVVGWLLIALASTTVSIAVTPSAGAAVPGAAPSNPTTPCTWNWNRWTVADHFDGFADDAFDPTQSVFSRATSALGANGWYQASRAPNFSYFGLAESVGPAEEVTNATDAEWTYGVGYYLMTPGATQTITLNDPGRADSHAFAFYDSSGNQFDRFPRIASAQSGVHYIASEGQSAVNPSQSGGDARSQAWSQSINIRVPNDGVVYIHYLHFDESQRGAFVQFGGACDPPASAVADISDESTPASTVTLNVVENDSNVNPATVEIVGADNQTGALVVEDQGTWRVAGGGEISFVPVNGFVSDPTPIRYTVRDSRGVRLPPTQVSIDYRPVFSAADESLANPTGEPVTILVTENDSSVNPATLRIVGANPSTGVFTEEGRGSWSVDRTAGSIIFAPEDGVEADPQPIEYAIADVGGNQLPSVGVSVSFAPELGDDLAMSNEVGRRVTVEVIENDLTFDIDPTTVALVADDGRTNELKILGEGTWSVDPETQKVHFIPEATFVSDPRPIRYTLADVDGNFAPPAVITIDYLPQTTPDESLDNPAGFTISLDLVSNDLSTDIDQRTTAIDHPDYDPVTKSLRVPGQGIWVLDSTSGAITFQPETGFRGEPTPISYIVADDDGNFSVPTLITIGHRPIPQAAPDNSLDNDLQSTVRISVLANDPSADDIDPATLSIVGAQVSSGELTVPGEGTWTVDETVNQIVFVPRLAFEGNPQPIHYVVADARGVETEPTLVTVTFDGASAPRALAFSEPVDTNWPTVWLLGSLIVALLIAVYWLSRPAPQPSPVLTNVSGTTRPVRRG